MDDVKFMKLFQRVVEQYALTPEAANALLQRILSALETPETAALQAEDTYEILMEYLERE